MNNIEKYKLSQYKDIRPLNDDDTVFLSYDIANDRTCIRKIVDEKSKHIYEKIRNINNNLIIKIYDIIQCDKDFIIIEEYIKGKSIQQIVEDNVLLLDTACKYAGDIADMLSSIHEIGIIHRDISPNNVIIDENDRARLLDFDISRIKTENKTMDTTILGTAGFASPEQFGFAQTDVRSDIYSLGVLLNYMLTGHIVQYKITDNICLKPIIEKATKINPDDRYQAISEMKEAFGCYYKKISVSETNVNKRFSYIPGFRTKDPGRMILALMFYITYIYCFIEFLIGEIDFNEFMTTSMSFIAIVFIPMWWFGNEGKEWDRIPFMRNKDQKTKKSYAITIYVFVVIALAMLSNIFE